MKPLVYEWDHHRQRYVTPGDRVECLKERVVAADDYVAEVERLTQAGNYYMSQLADAKDEVERLKKVREDAFHCVNAALRQRGDALEEVERLRGIVQADLEEKAEAWGEVERLKAQLLEHAEVCKEGPWPATSLRGTLERAAKILRGSEHEDQGAAYDAALALIEAAIGASPSPRTAQEGT